MRPYLFYIYDRYNNRVFGTNNFDFYLKYSTLQDFICIDTETNTSVEYHLERKIKEFEEKVIEYGN